MRFKEEAQDYRYFPEPDLVPFVVDEAVIDEVRTLLPELPRARAERFQKEFGLSEYDTAILTSKKDLADYFEECAKLCGNRKTLANWVMGDITAELNLRDVPIAALGITPEGLAELLRMMDDGIISGKMAKEILAEAIETRRRPAEIVRDRGLSQITDAGTLGEVIRTVMARETKSVADYRSGKTAALVFLIGQVMKETKGKANPTLVNEILKKNLGASA
jgi:aspartyl-tRNA(Asn)/glutamyl-tRNA(Gln) amidotransferase subunit B